MPNYYQLLKLTGISKTEVATYFLNLFNDSFVLVLALLIFLGCFLAGLSYLAFMKKHKTTHNSLLNVLNGNLAVFFIFSSFMELIEIVGEKTDTLQDSIILCVAANVKKILKMNYILLFLQLSIATLLHHVRPDLYLEVSLKWKNIVITVFMFLVAVINQFIYIFSCDFDNLCTFECPPKKNQLLRKLNSGFAFLVIVSCLLTQLGVVVDVHNDKFEH